jgi:general secretion pathway protein H
MHYGKKGGAGFTLLEVLIVLVIIGVVIAAVTLTISSSDRGQAAKTATNLLRARMLLAQERALIKSSTLGLSLSQKGYQFYVYQNTPPQEVMSWQKITEPKTLGYQAWPKSFTLKLSLPDIANAVIPNRLPQSPMIVFNPGTGVTPFTLHINAFKIIGKPNGEIKIAQ